MCHEIKVILRLTGVLKYNSKVIPMLSVILEMSNQTEG